MKLSSKTKYAIKVGLAMVMVYWIAMSVDWMNPQWAAFAIAFVAFPGQGQSLNKGLERLAGTVLGCIVALLVGALFSQDRWGFFIVVGLYCGVMTYLMTGSRHAYVWNVAGFVVLIIALTGMDSVENYFQHAMFRTIETAMGVGVWTLIAVFLWPQTNIGLLRDTQGRLLSAQGKTLRALAGFRSQDDTAARYAEARQESAQALQQLSSALHAAEAENYEVNEVRRFWERYLLLSNKLMVLLDRWYWCLPELRPVDIPKAVPNNGAFQDEVAYRFKAMQGMHNGQPPTREPRYIDPSINETEYAKLTPTDRAVIEVTLRQFSILDRLTREMFDCTRVLTGFLGSARLPVEPREVPTTAGSMPVLDPDRVRLAVMVASCFWLAFLLWIYFDPPGHASLYQIIPTFGMATAMRPQGDPINMLKPFAIWLTIGILCYVFIMPLMSSFLQLAILIFVFTFFVSYFTTGLGHLAGMIAFLMMMPIQNQQSYSFAADANNFVFLMICILAAWICSFISRTPRPEQALLHLWGRYTRSVIWIISRAEHLPLRNGVPRGWRWRFHRQEVASLPAKIGAWAQAIDHSRLPEGTADKMGQLHGALGMLSYRLDEFVDARNRPHSPQLLSALKDEFQAWSTAFDGALLDLSSRPESMAPAGMRRSLADRLSRMDEQLSSPPLLDQGEDSTGERRANLYALVGAYRGVSEAGITLTSVAQEIDWPSIREERFPSVG